MKRTNSRNSSIYNLCIDRLAAALCIVALFAPLAQSGETRFQRIVPPEGMGVALGADAVSANGEVVVGTMGPIGALQAFRWTRERGAVALGDLPGGPLDSRGYGVSADGQVVVGMGTVREGTEAFRWTAEDGMESLGEIPGGLYGARATAVSADGSVIAGGSFSDRSAVNPFGSPRTEAFRWTRAGGMERLGFFGRGSIGPESLITDMTPNGDTLIGFSGGRPDTERFFEAVRWTQANGFEPVSDIETSTQAHAVSDDGQVVVGMAYCLDPREQAEGSFHWNQESGPGDTRCSEHEVLVDVSGDGRIVVGAQGSVHLDSAEAVSVRTLLELDGIDVDGWVFTELDAISADGLTFVGFGVSADGPISTWIAKFADCDGDHIPDALERAVGREVICGEPAFQRGDADVDGRVTISDAVTILLQMFRGKATRCAKASDADDDASINITDAVYLLGFLFQGGDAPPSPFGSCGVDPSPDAFSCDEPCGS